MRAYITISQQGNDTVFTYEHPGTIAEQVTIAQQRQRTFYDRNIAEARLLRQNPQDYLELGEYDDSEGFAIVNAVLICRAAK